MSPNLDCVSKRTETFFLSSLFFFVLWYIYKKDKKFGLYFAIFSLIAACLTPFLTNYGPAVLMKIVSFTVFALLLFASVQYKCLNLSNILTNLFRLNIGCMIITVSEWWVVLLLMLATITTPIVSVENGKVLLKSVFVAVNAWVLLSAFALIMAYFYNPFFCINLNLVLAAIIIPTLIHFVSNQFLEARLLFLCLTIWIHLLQNSEQTWAQVMEKFKFY